VTGTPVRLGVGQSSRNELMEVGMERLKCLFVVGALAVAVGVVAAGPAAARAPPDATGSTNR